MTNLKIKKHCIECGYTNEQIDAFYEGIKFGRTNIIEEFRELLKNISSRNIPQHIWNLGVDNTCNNKLKEQIE